jgi:uncharacterized lipoprotein YajG
MPVANRVRTDLPNSEQSGGDYTVTNHTDDRTYNADSASNDELSDVLGSVISDLIALGILSGSVAT